MTGRWNRTTYGHDLENIFLIADASAALGDDGYGLEHHQRAFASAVRDGFDRKSGGFYYWGRFGLPATRRHKAWWVQADALVSAIEMFRMTGEERYLEAFVPTLAWVINRQVDWQHGDWYEAIQPNGRPTGPKAGPMKCCYHTGRALLRCLAALDQL